MRLGFSKLVGNVVVKHVSTYTKGTLKKGLISKGWLLNCFLVLKNNSFKLAVPCGNCLQAHPDNKGPDQPAYLLTESLATRECMIEEQKSG